MTDRTAPANVTEIDVYEQTGDRRIATIAVVDDWYEPTHREPRSAWVVEWVEPEDKHPIMHRGLVELGNTPISDDTRRRQLLSKARTVVARGRPADPEPFGAAITGSATRAELFERTKLAIYAVDAANARVRQAARRNDEFEATSLAVALTEMLAWVRSLDEFLGYLWQGHVTESIREQASIAIDRRLERLTSIPADLLAAARIREADRKPYADWTFALISKGLLLERRQLRGLRWLAGKMLHFGPLPVAELRHSRAGARPDWVWRPADEIFPPTEPERQHSQRAAYEKHLRGRTITSTLSLTIILIETEFLIYRLLRDSDEDTGVTWGGT